MKLKIYLFLSILSLSILTLTFNQNLKERLITQTLNEMGLTSDKTYQLEFQVEKPVFKDVYLVSPAHQSYFKTAFNMFKGKDLFWSWCQIF